MILKRARMLDELDGRDRERKKGARASAADRKLNRLLGKLSRKRKGQSR